MPPIVEADPIPTPTEFLYLSLKRVIIKTVYIKTGNNAQFM